MSTYRKFVVVLLAAMVVAAGALVSPSFVAAEAGEARPGTHRAEAQVVAAGGAHTCVVVAVDAGPGGDVRCWGDNAYGQLGLGTTDDRGDQPGEMASTPSVALGAKALAVTAGRWHTCALLVGGAVKCWGRNQAGQLGLGDTANRGDGANEMGNSLPAINLGSGRSAVAVAAGGSFTCALLDNASVKCWGSNTSGQLGVGDTANRGDGANEMGDNLPSLFFGDNVSALVVAAGQDHACAIVVSFTEKSLRCWGENSEGQLGLGNTADRGDGPFEVATAAPNVPGKGNASALALGRAHTCVLTGNFVACWGANNSGQLGRGTVGQNRGDAAGEINEAGGPYMDSAQTVVGLTAMADGTCVVVAGATKCWGENGRGQLGINSAVDVGGPTFDLTSATAVVQEPGQRAVTGGDQHACVVTTGRDIACWGGNDAGQLGLGDLLDVGTLARTMSATGPVPMRARHMVAAIDTSNTHVCAIVDDGQLKCWGAPGTSPSNALGSGTAPQFIGDSLGEIATHPTVDLGPGRSAVQVSTGMFFSCAVLDNGKVACWGDNTYGQLGLGHSNGRGNPGTMGANLATVDLGSGRTALSVSAGTNHACAVLDDHSLKCWGANNWAQLGIGSTSNRGDHSNEMGDNLPAVNLGTGRTALAVGAGTDHTCALLDNHTVKCWGDSASAGNGSGILYGDTPGDMGDNLPVVQLGTGRTAVELAVSETTCAILDNGTVKCWGLNYNGSAGVGSTATIGFGAGEMGDALPAVGLGTGRTAVAIVNWDTNSCAILDNSTMRCWGRNHYGQLGVDDALDRGDEPGEMGDALPTVKLPTGVVPTAAATGSAHTCVVTTTQELYCWGFSGLFGLGGLDRGLGDAAGEMAALTAVDLGGSGYKVLETASPAGTPDAPELIGTVVGGAQSATLQWVATDSAGHNGAPLTGYRIEYATASVGPWSISVADTGSTATSGTAVGLPADTTVYLRVRGINSAGVGGPSNIVSVETTTGYVALTPFRLADTRAGATTGDGQQAGGGALTAGQTYTVQVGGRGGVFANARAAVLNLTAVNPTGSGFLTLYPCDVSRPNASTLNFVAGRTAPNAAVAKLSAAGTVCVYASADTHLLVDVSGMYPSASPYLPLSPARVVDTRPTGVTLDSLFQGGGPLAAGDTESFVLIGRGGLPAEASPGGAVDATPGTVVLNLTSANAAAGGYLTVWGCQSVASTPRPATSNLNFPGGRAIANLVYVEWGGSGDICIYSSQTSNVIVDVVGFIPASSGNLPLAPERLADTRASGSTVDGQGVATGVVGAGQTLTVQVTPRALAPANTAAAVLNVTAVLPPGSGFLTVFPCDVSRPTASNLNYSGQTVANMVISKLSASGTVCIYASSATHVIVDIFGVERE